MSWLEFRINLALEENGCTVISPWNDYTRDEYGVVDKTIPRAPENMLKLEETISECMKKLYQKSLMETLEKEAPIMYIDCQQKWDDDIMLFILKEYARTSKINDKGSIISKVIERRTIVIESPQKRKEYIDQNQPNSEEMLNHYSKCLKTYLSLIDSDPKNKNIVLGFECDVTFEGLAKFMEKEDIGYMYLYLDKIQSLSLDEQSRINRLLFARWGIRNDKYIRIKINNGNKWWKTWYTDGGHRAEAIHDYSEHHVYKKDL